MKKNASDKVILVLPTKSEYVSTARLTASSVANRIGFNIEEVEDIKVAVSEVCNIILAKLGDKISQYQILFNINGRDLEIIFTSESDALKCFDESIENEYGIYIMRALMDSVTLCKDTDSIVMTKKIGE